MQWIYPRGKNYPTSEADIVSRKWKVMPQKLRGFHHLCKNIPNLEQNIAKLIAIILRIFAFWSATFLPLCLVYFCTTDRNSSITEMSSFTRTSWLLIVEFCHRKMWVIYLSCAEDNCCSVSKNKEKEKKSGQF